MRRVGPDCISLSTVPAEGFTIPYVNISVCISLCVYLWVSIFLFWGGGLGCSYAVLSSSICVCLLWVSRRDGDLSEGKTSSSAQD